MQYVDLDITEAIEGTEKGYWFNFEEVLVEIDSLDPNMQDNDGRGICKFYQKKGCSKGNNCPYRHTRSERSVVCKHWLRALCKKGDMCEFLHQYDLSKMPECFFFSKYGECSNPECMYLHINPEDKVRECPWYKRGFCKHGMKCRHKHLKNVMCENFFHGFCPEGPECSYAHPRYELPRDERDHNVCHLCGQQGHISPDCPQRKGGRKSFGRCFECGDPNHFSNNCPNKRYRS